MVFDINGNIIGDVPGNPQNVYISDIKAEHQSYTDDDLLSAAIIDAQSIGPTAKIIWDGTDIAFSGSVSHEIKGFGGIDFNNSRIIMPNYDGGTILNIVPDSAEDLTVDADDIYGSYTTDSRLFAKVFGVNDNQVGNADMCLGDRAGSFTSTIYCSPTILTTPTGYYETGELFLVPEDGTVTCYNVHDYPAITLEVSNATIVTNSAANMTRFIHCNRSNVHIHNFKFIGRSAVTTYHPGVMSFHQCCSVEIDHFSGVNPIQEALTSGYVIGLFQVSFVHVHDVYVGDNLSWGAVGSNHLTNTTFERCYLNRWDCHYAQYGVNVVRDCNLNKIQYGIGRGMLLFENCNITETRESESVVAPISLRSDCPGAYDGDIVVRNCVFATVSQPANLIVIWQDSCYYAIPENSKVTVVPKRRRTIERCLLIDGCKSIFEAGSRITADQARYADIEYVIKDSTYSCSDVVVGVYDSNQTLGAIIIDGCRSRQQCYIAKDVQNAIIKCMNTNFENKTVHVVKNINEISVVQCRLNSVASDQTSSYLMLLGCRLYGSQAFTNFNNYSAYGNCAGSKSDTPAININVS